MPIVKGISFIDLLGAPRNVVQILPNQIEQFIEQFNLLTLQTSTAEDRLVYTGKIQTPLNEHDFDDFVLEIPGLQDGIPFRLFKERANIDPGEQIEDNTGNWIIQLDVLSITVKLPFEAAKYIPETTLSPARLEAHGANKPDVKITVEAGVLEITSDGDFRIRPDLSFDPNTPADVFLKVRINPPNFYLVKPVGARIGLLIFDFSRMNSPVQARIAGVGDDFQGAYIEEATVFIPDIPLVGQKFQVNVSLKEALIGNAFVGEGIIDIGADLINTPPTPTFFQVVNGTKRPLSIGADNTIEFDSVIFPSARIIAVADVNTPWEDRLEFARWLTPDGERQEGARTLPFEVEPGATLEYTYQEGQEFQVPPTQIYTFTGNVAEGAAARFRLVFTNPTTSLEQTFEDVTFISAAPNWLQNARLEITDLDPPLPFSWKINYDVTLTRTNTDSPDLSLEILQTPQNGQIQTQRVGISVQGFSRFVIVDVRADIPAVIVSEGRPKAEDDTEVLINNFGPVYHRLFALRNGELRQLQYPEPEIPAGETEPNYQPGRVYEARTQGTVSRTTAGNPRNLDVFSIFYATSQSNNAGIVDTQTFTNVPDLTAPAATSLGSSRVPLSEVRRELSEWIGHLQSGNIYVIGRTSRTGDVNTANSPSSNADLGPNERLERERARNTHQLVQEILNANPNAGVNLVGARGEYSEGIPGGWQEALGSSTRLANAGSNATVENHELFQRADIYFRSADTATGGDASFTAESGSTEDVSTDQRVLIPGPARAPSPPVRSIDTEARLRRLRLAARWDREPIPTSIEAQLILQMGAVPVPIDADLNTSPDETTASCPDAAEDFLRIMLRFVQDARTGMARWSAAIDSAEDEDGLFRMCDTKALGVMLLLGPVIATDPPVDEADQATVRWAAAGGVLATSILLTVLDDPIIKNVNVTVNSVGVEFDFNNILVSEGDFELEAFRILLDYSVSFEVDLATDNLGGIRTEDGSQVRIRYRNIGLEFTGGSEIDSFDDISWDNFNFLFDPSKAGNVTVEDAGRFLIDGAIGDILNVSGVRLGHGSLFLELDLVLGIDLGVVEISETTLRIEFKDGDVSVSIRGIEAKVDIPQTLKGSGGLYIGDGEVKAELELEIIPAGLYASGSLVLSKQADYTAVAVGVDVELPTGIPLASTGLGIFGFFGRFAANMKRNANIAAPDRIAEELRWFRALLGNSTDIWTPEHQTWGLGLGVVIGTLPDGGKSFHAKGGLVLEIPGPTVIFGIDASFLSKRRDKKSNDVSGAITGLVLVDPYTVLIGIEVNIDVGDFLEIVVPIGMLFPRAPLPGETEKDPYYIRIGSDGINPRTGSPARATIKAGNLGNVAKVFAFLMVEERELLNLYGKDELDFHGFSIGFGVGIELGWGNDFISLKASALLLVGLGTSPFAIVGILNISGEIRLLVFSISASAELAFRHDKRGTVFTGEFCAEISLFFFSVKGCVSFTIGDGDPYTVLPPPLQITGFGLMNRKGEKIEGIQIDPESDENERQQIDNPVWPDAIPVLNFAHAPATNLAASSAFGTIVELDRNEEVTVGDYVYTFSLDSLTLERRFSNTWQSVAGPLDAAWWFPSWRTPFTDDPSRPPSGEEGRDLGLLTWHPSPWAKMLIPDANTDTFDDIGEGINRICDPIPLPPIDCAKFEKVIIGPSSTQRMVNSQNNVFKAIIKAYGFVNTARTEFGFESDYAYIHDLAIQHPNLMLQAAMPLDWGIVYTWAGLELQGGQLIPQLRTINFVNIDTPLPPYTLSTCIEVEKSLIHGKLLLAIFEDEEMQTISEEVKFPEIFLFDEEKKLVGKAEMQILDLLQTTMSPFRIVEYTAPAAAFKYWQIGAFYGRGVLLATCGRDAKAYFHSQNMQRIRSEWREHLENHSESSAPSATPLSPSQFVLEANSEYRIQATWSWQGWHKKKLSDKTAPQSVTQTFHFQTADYITDFNGVRTSLEQDKFDARALRHYVTKTPSLSEPPMFLEDTLQVSFIADHIESLLSKYNRSLEMEVLRVDVPQQELTDGGGPISVQFDASYTRNTFFFIDGLIKDISKDLPCTGDQVPQLGGVDATLDINLAPLARYELILYGLPTTNPEEIRTNNLIVRAPFFSSRYANPQALFQNLGFMPSTEIFFADTEELILDTALSTSSIFPTGLSPILNDDVALAEALSNMGFDDNEIPTQSRILIIWQIDASANWQIMGVLLDAPEPIHRPNRLEIDQIEFSGQRLEFVRASKEGSRLLFFNPSPSALNPNVSVELEIQYQDLTLASSTQGLTTHLLPRPVILSYEV